MNRGQRSAGALERYVSVEADGTLCLRRGFKLGGKRVEACPKTCPQGRSWAGSGRSYQRATRCWGGPPPEHWLRKT